LISYKDRKEKEQFEFKDQQNVKFCWASEKQDEMKEFAKKMKDNLDQWKRFQRRIKGRFEKADKADDDLEKSEALDELKSWTIKLKWRFTE
jgi:hypothetical protein